MKFCVKKDCLMIYSQSEQDIAYIHDTLGLKKEGDSVRLVYREGYYSDLDSFLQTVKEKNDVNKN